MLKSLIDRIFVNKQEEIFILLEKYDLANFLSGFISKIDDFEISPDLEHRVITSLSSTFLTRINTILEKVENLEDKTQLEYILSEISNELIFQIVQKEGISKEDILKSIKGALITTSEANGWKTTDLLKMIKIDLYHSITAKSQAPLKINKVTPIVYYEWLKDENLLDQLAYDIKSHKMIKSVKEFKSLFQSHDGDIRVHFNREKLDLLIVFFDQLKCRNFIKMKGARGHFVPLKEYGIDFDKKVLIKTQPKRIKESITKNEYKFKLLLETTDKLIGSEQK